MPLTGGGAHRPCDSRSRSVHMVLKCASWTGRQKARPGVLRPGQWSEVTLKCSPSLLSGPSIVGTETGPKGFQSRLPIVVFGSQGGGLLPKRGADVARTLPAPCPHIAHMGCRRCPQLQNKHHLGIRGVRKIGIRQNVVPIWSSFVFPSLGGPVCPSLSQSAPVSPRLS